MFLGVEYALDEMLAVVEHQEDVLGFQIAREDVGHGPARLIANSHSGRHGLGYHRPIGDRR